jgi:hypothetical protein
MQDTGEECFVSSDHQSTGHKQLALLQLLLLEAYTFDVQFGAGSLPVTVMGITCWTVFYR